MSIKFKRTYQGRNIWDDPIIEKSQDQDQRAAATNGPGPDPDPDPGPGSEHYYFF